MPPEVSSPSSSHAVADDPRELFQRWQR
ncbi:MAG: hypothetical protein QOI03_1166, partial [Solirubrobacteraceae bacterium]|nr:hypothetical protein [Solirubrobacteraceae bacterium]